MKGITDKCIYLGAAGRAAQDKAPDFQDMIYIARQVIVAGKSDEIDEIVDVLRSLGLYQEFGLEPEDRFPMGDDEMVYLYTIGGRDRLVEQVVCEINELSAALGLAVDADPNYHLSPAEWIGAGSPWTQNGDWVGTNGGGKFDAALDYRAFHDQWALGPQGMRLWDRSGGRSVPETGQGVRIGIFDTSPFTDTVEIGSQCSQCPLEQLMEVSGLEQFRADMRLTVWHPELIAAPTCPGWDRHLTGTHSLEGQDISNHGLFVAGLAHVVAPESEIYLIRVLEADGCGGLYSIAKNILAWQESAPQDAHVTDTVINLSLGVHRPPCPGDFGLPLWCPRDLTVEPADEEAEPSGAVCLLRRVEALVQDRGVVVVAAAGNDSYQDVAVALSAEMPAGHPDVIGVAASTDRRMRGCFSNRGDVAAPGGDGDANCVVPNCVRDDDPQCLISLVNEPRPGYRYWVGTSFATPLVSGLSALVVQDLREAGEIGNLTAVVRARLTGSAVLPIPLASSGGLGAGIVDVQSVLGP